MKNMKRFTKTVALIVSMMGFGGIALAQCKVAVVNMQEVIVGSSEGKALSGKFDARVREWKQKLDLIRREIENAQVQLVKGQNGNPNQADIAELNRAILQKKDELAVTTSAAQNDVDRYRESLLAPIEKSAIEIAKAVAAERGIDSVMDSSSPTASFPINADATNCDITSEVKRRMNAKFSLAAMAK